MERYFSGSPWESKSGYCRAIRVKDQIEVSGTVAVDAEGNCLGTSYSEQTKASLAIIGKAIRALGGSRKSIIRTRMYCLDISKSEEILTENAAFFGADVPVTSLLEVSGFIRDDFLIEIEASAVVEKRPV